MDRAVVKYTPTDNHVEHKAKEKSKKEAQKDRAVRLEKSDVTDLIFSAFEKHQFYRFFKCSLLLDIFFIYFRIISGYQGKWQKRKALLIINV